MGKTQAFIVFQLCLVTLVLSASVQERFSGPSYNAQTGQQKLDQLWSEITADTTPLGWYSILQQLGIFTEKASPTFDTYSDVFPEGRKLLTHTIGTVGQVDFIAESDSPYTGVFQGSTTALLRFATATESHPKSPPFANFNPALALKFLRDNVSSANILAMYDAEGQDNWNPFGYDWSNHLPVPKTMKIKALSYKFSFATPWNGRLGLRPCGEFDSNGQELDLVDIKIPFRIIFSPTAEVKNMFPETFSELLADQIKKIPVGTNIYDVLAIEKPYADAVKIGTLRSKTAFTTSKFGDKHLFFQHSYFENDLALHPEWEEGARVEPPIPYKKA